MTVVGLLFGCAKGNENGNSQSLAAPADSQRVSKPWSLQGLSGLKFIECTGVGAADASGSKRKLSIDISISDDATQQSQVALSGTADGIHFVPVPAGMEMKGSHSSFKGEIACLTMNGSNGFEMDFSGDGFMVTTAYKFKLSPANLTENIRTIAFRNGILAVQKERSENSMPSLMHNSELSCKLSNIQEIRRAIPRKCPNK